jgi:hypothetical protein
LVGTAVSKDVEVTTKTRVKGYFPQEELAFDQSGRRNFLVTALASYPVVDGMIETVMSKSDSRYIEHTLEYYADANKNIRIHILVTGPEFASYTSDRESVKANTYYWWSVNWNDTWKTGVYKVTFIIEVLSGKGGSTLVETYSFVVY